MKKIALTIVIMMTGFAGLLAQTNNKRPVVGVASIDTKQLPMPAAQFIQLARLELVNIDSFEVLDSYDIRYMVEEKDPHLLNNCFAKACIVEAGKLAKADKLMSGSLIMLDGYLMVNLKWIDIEKAIIEKEITQKYYYQNENENIPTIISFSVRHLLNLPVDSLIWNNITYNQPKQVMAGPKIETINLSGPRLGFTLFTGKNAEILNAPVSSGGFDASPYMFQFGYQFELRYLNEGKYQALFEFIPMITGFDQGYFIPSLTILNGLRSNINGFEFGIGPSFNFINKADGFYDNQNNWHLAKDTANGFSNFQMVSRLDSRGELQLHTGAVITVGKTFRSGKLNIPMNFYFVPSRNGHRFGLSFGFNANRKR